MMRIIEQGHEILHMDGIERIERAGRTCYKSEDKIGCTRDGFKDMIHQQVACPAYRTGPGELCGNASCEHHSSHRFARMLIKRGHMAMIEHASASVKFITNRGVTHEMVRHRLCAFGQESTRYVNYGGDDIQFIRPVWCSKAVLGIFALTERPTLPDDGANTWLNTMSNLELEYKRLLQEGWRPEQAREVLPNSLKTEIVVTANFREWIHIFQLRALGTTGKPHPQMQALMLPVLAEFQKRCPAVFGHLVEEVRP